MPVQSITLGTLTLDGNTVTVDASATTSASGKSQADIQLVAVDENGNTFIISTIPFQQNSGNTSTPIVFDNVNVGNPPLPPGTYTFRIDVVNNVNGQDIVPGPTFPNSVEVCFVAGTLIATPSGQVAVETLRPGDLVLTADGRAVPVRFVGKQTVATLFARPERANPIRIAAGALAENVPARDLLVSPNHGIVVDGVLAFASALVNGTTIAQVDAPAERFAYYSIETAGHEVILAEGCPAETFVDHVPRARWDNHADYVALYPEAPAIAEMDLPHAKSHRQVPAEIHARIAERAAALLGPARDAA